MIFLIEFSTATPWNLHPNHLTKNTKYTRSAFRAQGTLLD